MINAEVFSSYEEYNEYLKYGFSLEFNNLYNSFTEEEKDVFNDFIIASYDDFKPICELHNDDEKSRCLMVKAFIYYVYERKRPIIYVTERKSKQDMMRSLFPNDTIKIGGVSEYFNLSDEYYKPVVIFDEIDPYTIFKIIPSSNCFCKAGYTLVVSN